MIATENDRAQGDVNFIDETGFKEAGIDFAAAFAQQPLHLPFFTKPAEREGEIDFSFAADFNLVGDRAQAAQGGR